MAKIIFIHNQHDSVSRDALLEIQTSYPEAEIYDFMELRDAVHFQGAPSVLLVPADEVEISEQTVARKIELFVSPTLVASALDSTRILRISAPASAGVGQTVTVTIAAEDIDGNAASLPESTLVTIADQRSAPDTQGQIQFVSQEAGIYTIKAEADNSRAATAEVTIS